MVSGAATNSQKAFDVRVAQNKPTTPPPGRLAATTRFQKAHPTVQVDWDRASNGPRWIRTPGTFLAEADKTGNGAASGKGLAHRTLRTFLNANSDWIGHGAEVLAEADVKRDTVTAHNGLRSTVWQQQLDGIPVFEGLLLSHETRAGNLVSLSSRFIKDPPNAADRGTAQRKFRQAAPPIQGTEALLRAATLIETKLTTNDFAAVPHIKRLDRQQLFRGPALRGAARVQLTWFAPEPEVLKLAWDVVLHPRRSDAMYRVLLDAATGELLLRRSLTENVIPSATYRVFTGVSPAPVDPAVRTPGTNQPPPVARELVTLAALSTNASPEGWIGAGPWETLGNNVDAATDLDGDNLPDLPRPQAGTNLVFDFPLDLDDAPGNSAAAAVVNLFYWCNYAHDYLYDLGFTEAAGNFQASNFGRGGEEGDAILAEAQDGSGFNNANFSTPPDGLPGAMQMYLWDGPAPARDGDLDADIILHEYVHGLSNRRVGGGMALNSAQSRGLGEGWSDFYALAILSRNSDPDDIVRAFAAYSSYNLAGLLENNYYGIRRYPYCLDARINPLTFRDTDPLQYSVHPTAPINPLGAGEADEVHNVGEVWALILWQARGEMMRKHGTAGNRLMLQLVTDALALTPPEPTFTDARDAILQADLINHGGANQRELWHAFAQRGLGVGAFAPLYNTIRVVEAFDVPDALQVHPRGLTKLFGISGAIAPTYPEFVITNGTADAITWTMSSGASWLEPVVATSTISPGGSNVFHFRTTPQVHLLTPGLHETILSFSNHLSGVVQHRPFQLFAVPDAFTDHFVDRLSPLQHRSLTFFPDGANNYTVCRVPAAGFPTSPGGGIVLELEDDDFAEIVLTNAAQVALYGQRFDRLFIGSNGYITLGSGDISFDETINRHFDRPRISICFSDFEPSSGGTVSWKQLPDRVVVTYENMRAYSAAETNDFQAELFFDGTLRLTHLHMDAMHGIIGLSRGNVPLPFVSSRFADYLPCPAPLALVLPALAYENQGTVTGRVVLPFPSHIDRALTVTTSDPTQLQAPEAFSIPAGATNAPIVLTVVDNQEVSTNRPVLVSVSAMGYLTTDTSLELVEDDVAHLVLGLPLTLRAGGPPIDCEVQVNATLAAPFEVQIVAQPNGLIGLPSSIWLPVGATSAIVTLVPPPADSLIHGARTVSISMRAANWPVATHSTQLLDPESSALALEFPALLREGDVVEGLVRLNRAAGRELALNVTSTLSNRLLLPESISIPAGATQQVFSVRAAAFPGASPTVTGALIVSLAGLEPAEALFALRDADPARLVLEPWSDSSLTAGVARALSITALDLEGAPLPDFAGPLSFELITPDATNSLALSGTFSNGTFSSVLILTQAIDGLELVVHSGALSERSPLFDVVPGPMHTLAWAAFEPVQRTTVAFPVSVQARDAFLNPITSSNAPALDLALLTGEPVFAPLSLTQYVAGVWSGELVFTQALASAQLEARLETIHGTSDPFTVLPANDLALYLLNPPSVLGWSNLFSLTLLLTNSGPDTLSSLTLTQSLAGLELAAAEGPGWTRSLEGIALSEPLTNGALLTVQLPFIASAPGLWTNLLHASAEQPDPSPENNQASWVLAVTNDLPVITFLAPLDQTIHPATNLVISLEATDHHGITQLLLQADDLLLASWSEPPFSFTWTNLPPGLHQLRATAFDPAGASNSSLISIQIEEALRLALEFPALLREGDVVEGLVRLNRAAGRELALNVTSTLSNRLLLPESISIPAGATQQVFSVRAAAFPGTSPTVTGALTRVARRAGTGGGPLCSA